MRLVFELHPRHRLLALFLATALLPSGALAWLGWQLVEQDHQLERQRVQDALETTAAATAAAIERELSALERSLVSLLETGPGPQHTPSVIVARFTRAGVTASAGAPLLFRPSTPRVPVSGEPEPWGNGERLEFQQRDLTGAIHEYGGLVQNDNREIRAGALLRLARALKKANRHDAPPRG